MTPAAPLRIGFAGGALRLAEPRALWLLAAVAALAVVGAAGLWRRRAALARAAGRLGPRLAPEANLTRPATRLSLALLGLACLAGALARPQSGARSEVARRIGLDLVIALDVSRSMLARDVRPDRLSRAKLEIGGLLDGLAGDRVGIVVFAADAFVQCPLTTDLAAAKLFLRAAEPDAIPRQGTDFGNALLASRDSLAGSERGPRSRVVLLVSDGEDHEGGAARAAAALAASGIRVFALAVGTREGAPIPASGEDDGGWKKDRSGALVVSHADEAALAEIAARGGGEVFDVSSAVRGLVAFRSALDRMERSELEARVTVAYEDRYAALAFPALLLLLASLLVKEARPRRGAGVSPVEPGPGEDAAREDPA